jgi:hypothetical protein
MQQLAGSCICVTDKTTAAYLGDQRRSMISSAAIAASPRMIIASQPSIPRHAGASVAPPRATHRVHTANVVAPPSVSSQQSPHTGLRQRAHGPTAVHPQIAQRADGASPLDWSEPIATPYRTSDPTSVADDRVLWEDPCMLKIDRHAFLALALGMNLGACYTASPPPSSSMGNQQRSMPGPTSEAGYGPVQECVGWTPAGECNQWEPRQEAMAPVQECVGWTPAGECNQWAPGGEAFAPVQECVAWTPANECSRWEPRSER